MRLSTYRVPSPLGSIARLGAERDGRLIDLNAAAGFFFHEQMTWGVSMSRRETRERDTP